MAAMHTLQNYTNTKIWRQDKIQH